MKRSLKDKIFYNVKRLTPEHGDVLVLNIDVPESEMHKVENLVSSLGEMLQERGIPCPLVVLGKGSTMDLIKDQDLSRLGLYRKEPIKEDDIDKIYG